VDIDRKTASGCMNHFVMVPIPTHSFKRLWFAENNNRSTAAPASSRNMNWSRLRFRCCPNSPVPPQT